MNVRQPEAPSPAVETCNPVVLGFFSPPAQLTGGPEGRLSPALRIAAGTKNAAQILTMAAVGQCMHNLGKSDGLEAMAFADLAVTGRAAFMDFVTHPPVAASIQAAATAQLGTMPGATPLLISQSVTQVLDRAYQVAWHLRTLTPRGNLGWIATSGEDDLPHRPVNVPRSAFPQCDLTFTVPATNAVIPVQTRYVIATATTPPALQTTFPRRDLPPVNEPYLPPNDRVILFMHGSDSRLEEADAIIPHLVRTPDGRPSGISVISMDLPGSGYVNPIDHLEVGPWSGLVPNFGPFGADPTVQISLLPFLEQFIVAFVATLGTRLGVSLDKRIVAVMGGSLGGNLALRLARRSEPWLRNAVAFSPGSIWNKSTNSLILAGIVAKAGEPATLETGASRGDFFAGAFDQKIPLKTQPDQWFRDTWPCKVSSIMNARLDRRETYTSQYRRWHWRVSLEELAWSWQNPAVQNFRSRLLLGAGAADDYGPANIYSNTVGVAPHLTAINGDTFFFLDTGHSIHSERPAALAQKIATFVARVRGGHKADDYDGDGKSDFAVWRPTDGNWFVTESSTNTTRTQQWGQAGDIPVPGDYDGDGKTDFAVWRPSEGNWYVINSSTGVPRATQQWGLPGDIPVPGDYDGDGKTDFAVWRPSAGTWHVIASSTGAPLPVQQWGQAGDLPVPGDYDGDGKTDFAVWRPSDARWYVIDSTTKAALPADAWGMQGDIPLPGDYDGASYAVWTPSTGNWSMMDCSTRAQRMQQWGQATDVPVSGDFDGDGKTDIAVWRPDEGNWYVIDSSTNTSRVKQWGQFGDIPLPRRPAPLQMAPTPTFSIAPVAAGMMNIGIAAPGATVILYTNDGSTPNTTSHVYSGTFQVSSRAVIKAVALSAGQEPSAIATALAWSPPPPVRPPR